MATATASRTPLAAAGNRSSAPNPHWYLIDELSAKYSALTEAFRSLRTSVLLSAADPPPRSLLVSSAQPGEGKTTVSTNLAISLAQLGQRVLLIDGDLRRPSVHRAFGIRDSLGVVSYLTGQQDWRAAVEKISVPGLDVLVSGPIPPNPAELLSSDRMKKLLPEALEEYKFVVVDSPPLLNVADSRILATLVEGVVLVIKGGETPRELARRAQAYASDVGARVIGVVLNNVDLHREEYSYYQQYRYDSRSAPQDTGGGLTSERLTEDEDANLSGFSGPSRNRKVDARGNRGRRHHESQHPVQGRRFRSRRRRASARASARRAPAERRSHLGRPGANALARTCARAPRAEHRRQDSHHKRARRILPRRDSRAQQRSHRS